ncbi:MAG: hypothetical protein GX556_19065 [Fibrobacter sp.]|nr:hypothetical protein [Fibrobacter sp.]
MEFELSAICRRFKLSLPDELRWKKTIASYHKRRNKPMPPSLVIIEGYKIRRHYDEQAETWHFSIIDIIQAHPEVRLPGCWELLETIEEQAEK